MQKIHLLADAENSARQLASHLIHYIVEPEKDLGYEHMTNEVMDEIDEMLFDFGCEKVKIFAPSGEIIYSTDHDDIGTINTKDYFLTVVNEGTDYTTVVKTNNLTAEGQMMAVDVIETYVPLMFGERIVGVSEVYFEITEHRKRIEHEHPAHGCFNHALQVEQKHDCPRQGGKRVIIPS
jgi:hypothetical protein